jgi:hypothetical protein
MATSKWRTMCSIGSSKPSHSGILLAVIFLRPLCRLPEDPPFHPAMPISYTVTGAQLKTIQKMITLGALCSSSSKNGNQR